MVLLLINITALWDTDLISEERQITLCKIYINRLNLPKQYNSTNAHSYKVVMYMQKLHHFCNTSSPDDGPKLGRKYLGK